jgi:hypothetical protein
MGFGWSVPGMSHVLDWPKCKVCGKSPILPVKAVPDSAGVYRIVWKCYNDNCGALWSEKPLEFEEQKSEKKTSSS